MCIVIQIMTLVALQVQSIPIIYFGHACFTLSMWLGSVLLCGADVALITLFCAFTIASRRVLGYCMFSKARDNVQSLREDRYDIIYAIPLMITLLRICNTIRRQQQHRTACAYASCNATPCTESSGYS